MKRFITIIFVLCLSISLITSGCGGAVGTEKPGTTTEPNNDSTQAADSGMVTPAGQFPIVPADKPPVELSIVVVGDKPYDVENSAIKYIEEKCNIKLNISPIPATDAGTKLNLMLSSGDYPDIFQSGRNAGDPITFTTDRIEQFGAKDKILVPLNDYIEKYGVETKKLLDLRPEYKLKVSGSDGNIYGFPNAWECYHCTAYGKAWINVDWLNKLGLSMPQTTDELVNVLKAFKENDPNGNNKRDEIPFTGADAYNAQVEYWLLNSFLPVASSYNSPNLPNFSFATTDNKVVFSPIQDEYKEGLLFIKKLYDEGLIDQAASTQKLEQLTQLVRQDTPAVGIFTADHVGMGIDVSKMEQSKMYEVLPPVAGPKGVRIQGHIEYVDVTGFSGMVITDNCKYPEVAFRYGDMQYEEDMGMIKQSGKQGLAWDYAAAGTKTVGGNDAKYWWQATFSPDVQEEVRKHIFAVGPVNRTKDLWDAALPMPSDIYAQSAYEARLSLMTDKVVEYFYPGYVPNSLYMGADQETFIDIQTNLVNSIKTNTVQFITGSKDINKDWDNYVNELKGLGLDKYLEILQKKFDEYVATKN